MRLILSLLVLGVVSFRGLAQVSPPNVILVMADDQGYGDVGFRGHPHLKTPTMDDLARTAVRFERFYAAAPVCSPTRGSCLTGRHPFRYGITGANTGHMRAREHTLAELLKGRGYATGHFGKWHLGTLTKTERDSNRGGPNGAEHYAPPWEHGFDRCFSTEAKVPTYDPMITPPKWSGGVGKKELGSPYGTAYWDESGKRVTENLRGDDSRVIMDRAIPFIEAAVKDESPFFAVVWFHAPHLPVFAGPEHIAPYGAIAKDLHKHYYGCITALDEQLGRLRKKLRDLGVANDTMLWYCADNGLEGRDARAPGSSGGLRGRKRALFEGGVRVPAFLEWPGRLKEPRTIAAPCVTSDYLPTVLEAVGIEAPKDRELDGISLLPLLTGQATRRGKAIGFQSGRVATWMEDRYKLVRQKKKKMLFDIVADPAEKKDLAAAMPERVTAMTKALDAWRASCARSRDRQ